MVAKSNGKEGKSKGVSSLNAFYERYLPKRLEREVAANEAIALGWPLTARGAERVVEELHRTVRKDGSASF